MIRADRSPTFTTVSGRYTILAKITCAIPAYQAEPGVNFLLHSKPVGSMRFLSEHSCGFCSELFFISDLSHDADLTLFSNMIRKQHCFHIILTDIKTSSLHLMQKGHVIFLITSYIY